MARPLRLSEPLKTRGVCLTPRVWKAVEKRARLKRLNVSRYIERLIRRDLGPDWPEAHNDARYVHLGFKD